MTRTRVGLGVAWLMLLLAGLTACSGSGSDATSDAETTTTPVGESSIENAEPTAVVVAHRGASAYAPEHTFAAYDLAIQQGADYIEQDVQLTADGELVVLHDTSLDRTARGPAESCTGELSAKTLAQLRACDFGSWFNETNPEMADPAYVGLPIPTMREVLERYGPDQQYYIEIKSPEAQPGIEQKLLDLLDEFGLSPADANSRQVLIQSFSPDALRRVHALRPELPLVQLLVAEQSPVDATQLDGIRDYAIAIGPSKTGTDKSLVDAAHERCLDVHPYTVDEPNEMTQLLDLGVDGMFTNTPDLLRETISGRPGPPDHC